MGSHGGFAQRKTDPPSSPLRQQDTEYSCCPQRAFGQDSRPVWSMFLASCSFLSPVCGYPVVWPHPHGSAPSVLPHVHSEILSKWVFRVEEEEL